MFNIMCPKQCNTRNTRTTRKSGRVTKKRVALAIVLIAGISGHADASAPNALRVFEDCSVSANASATHAERSAAERFNALTDAERCAIADAFDPDFLERFSD